MAKEKEMEKLAALEHEQWVYWSSGLVKQLEKGEKLSTKRLERWKNEWRPYAELNNDVKEYDRKWARKVMKLVANTDWEREMDTILKEYEIIADSAQNVTTWRQNANNFFLTINSFLLSAGAYLVGSALIGSVGVAIIGITIAFLWRKTIIYYRALNEAKFDVILKIEEILPISIFGNEWAEFEKKKVPTTTKTEMKLPLIFMAAYVMVIAYYILTVLKL